MLEYYLCSIDIARRQFAGYSYKPVHWCSYHNIVYNDWLDLSPMSIDWYNAILLKDLDESAQTMLTLTDSVFRKVPWSDMSNQLQYHTLLQWDLLL